jgi:hypothetical protein
MVEWYWHGKTEELGEKPVPMPLCSPQILHGLTRARIRASALRDRRLNAVARFDPSLWQRSCFLRSCRAIIEIYVDVLKLLWLWNQTTWIHLCQKHCHAITTPNFPLQWRSYEDCCMREISSLLYCTYATRSLTSLLCNEAKSKTKGDSVDWRTIGNKVHDVITTCLSYPFKNRGRFR